VQELRLQKEEMALDNYKLSAKLS